MPGGSTTPADLVEGLLFSVSLSMEIVHVFVHVKADQVDQFAAASAENARNSIREPGIARFDVLQSNDDPTQFVLVEVYRSPEAVLAHKEPAHSALWRDAVAAMMAEPRHSRKYSQVFPEATFLV